MRRQPNFSPSLALSVLLNLFVFSLVGPMQGTPVKPQQRYTLHRLNRIKVKPATPAEKALPSPTAPERATPRRPASQRRNERRPAPRRSRPEPAASRVARQPGGGGGHGGGGPRTRPSEPSPALERTGGDGSRVAADRRAGSGNAFDARPALGDPSQPFDAGSAMALLPHTLPPTHRYAGVTRDAPTMVALGEGLRGGLPQAPSLGLNPTPGTAGSGSDLLGLAPQTTDLRPLPWAPTTPGLRLRDKGGPGLPDNPDAPVHIAAMPVAPRGHSGGGGGTAEVIGPGGGGPLPVDGLIDRSRGGGGSGMDRPVAHIGSIEVGPGIGGDGGGGNGRAAVGEAGGDGGDSLQLVPTLGQRSIVNRPGYGDPNGRQGSPGERKTGPGGDAADLDPKIEEAARQAGRGGDGDGPGRGHGRGSGDGDGEGPGSGRGKGGGHGDGQAVVARGEAAYYTGLIIDTLGTQWHHRPGSYDLHIGSAKGPRLATIGIYRYPSTASARAADRLQRGGQRNIITVRPLAIEYVVGAGEGARQRVIISAGDAEKIRESGLLREPSRIATVYSNNW